MTLKAWGNTDILIQDVKDLEEVPSWLNGTPILADTNMGVIYRGKDAVVLTKKMCALQHVESMQTKEKIINQQTNRHLNGIIKQSHLNVNRNSSLKTAASNVHVQKKIKSKLDEMYEGAEDVFSCLNDEGDCDTTSSMNLKDTDRNLQEKVSAVIEGRRV
jgi:hypothetical protein